MLILKSSRHPQAEVVGVDLVEGQFDPPLPEDAGGQLLTRSNITWRVPNSPHGPPIDFDDDHWDLGSQPFDYIRLGHLTGSVRDWPDLLNKCFQRLSPSSGYIEIMDIDWQARSANGRLRANSPFAEYWDRLQDASERQGCRFSLPSRNMEDMLESLGFDSIVHQRHRLPLTSWSHDPRQYKLGEWMHAFLQDSLETFGIGLLTQQLDFSPEQVRARVRACVEYASNARNRVFVTL